VHRKAVIAHAAAKLHLWTQLIPSLHFIETEVAIYIIVEPS